jgi:hypothetical protein
LFFFYIFENYVYLYFLNYEFDEYDGWEGFLFSTGVKIKMEGSSEPVELSPGIFQPSRVEMFCFFIFLILKLF